jgi:hypothetical protein
MGHEPKNLEIHLKNGTRKRLRAMRKLSSVGNGKKRIPLSYFVFFFLRHVVEGFLKKSVIFFGFLLSSYEIWESIGFTSEKSIFFLQISTFYIILYHKNMIKAKKEFRLSRAAAAAVR